MELTHFLGDSSNVWLEKSLWKKLSYPFQNPSTIRVGIQWVEIGFYWGTIKKTQKTN